MLFRLVVQIDYIFEVYDAQYFLGESAVEIYFLFRLEIQFGQHVNYVIVSRFSTDKGIEMSSTCNLILKGFHRTVN